MCGLAGFLDPRAEASADALGAQAGLMADSLRHRGPDAGGTWVDAAAGVALGHRRLAIIDLSDDGLQPMTSGDGRWVLAYNGELYNYRELRRRLEGEGARFRGSSDTEVLLESIASWGLDAALRASNGMFAFALWDRRERALHLARDRAGEKPLYYGWFGTTLLFGSELRALRSHPAFVGELDLDAVGQLLKLKYIPEPLTIYRRVRKLEPGARVRVDAATVADTATPIRWWSALEVAAEGLRDPLTCGMPEIVDQLDDLLRQAVERRMVADVPLGAFLSGGIDSSTIVALMQQVSPTPTRTFTIGVSSAAYDEAGDARRTAAHLGTDHTEFVVTPEQAQEVIPDLPTIFDEPFADSSQIPVLLVSRLARQDVTVALSGDGGDELFGGYNRHVWGPRALRMTTRYPRVARRTLGRALTGIAPTTWDGLARVAAPLHPRLRHQLPGEMLHKLGRALPADGPADLYDRLRSHWYEPQRVVTGAGDRPPVIPPALTGSGFSEIAMYLDLVDYLPGDILTKVDRAAMSVSLETRIPFLDPDVMAFAWRIPPALRIQGGQGKVPLREVLARYVPPALFDRPKSGFGIPMGAWLRGPLRGWAEDVLATDALDGLVSGAAVQRTWRDHLAGRANHQYRLWDVLMLGAWLQAN